MLCLVWLWQEDMKSGAVSGPVAAGVCVATLAIMIVQAIAALSVVVYYRKRGDTRWWSTFIAPGIGYWVAIPQSASGPLTIRGLPSEVQSCDLFAGWNLVGSLSAVESTSLADLNVVGASGTETLDLDHVYWWDGTSYVTPADIEPGMACWLASGAPCTLAVGGP